MFRASNLILLVCVFLGIYLVSAVVQATSNSPYKHYQDKAMDQFNINHKAHKIHMPSLSPNKG